MDGMLLKTKTVPELKAMCKAHNIKGYSGLNKDQLITLLKKDQKLDAAAPAPGQKTLQNLKLDQLKQLCKEYNITAYSKLKKPDLVKRLEDCAALQEKIKQDPEFLQKWVPKEDPELQVFKAFVATGRHEETTKHMDKEITHEDYLKYPSMQDVVQFCREHFALLKPAATQEEQEAQLRVFGERFVPPGLKGKVRGDRFNEAISVLVQKIVAQYPHLKFHREQQAPGVELTQTPDFYIEDTKTGRVLIGYNQVDLWKGGAQNTRADDYVISDTMHKFPNAKVVSVVYSDKVFGKNKFSKKSKVYKIFKAGVEKERMFYPGHLEALVKKYFVLA